MRSLYYSRKIAGVGRRIPIRAGDFDKRVVQADQEVTVFSRQVEDDQMLFHGYGSRNRKTANGFVGLDLVATGSAAGGAGDSIDGDVVLAITDSDGRRVKASTTFTDLETLRESLAENRSDRVIEPAFGDLAGPGRRLEVRVVADAASDGVEIDPTASSGKLVYGLFQG